MRLAIASPSSSSYSETFVRAQWERMPCVIRIHGGPVASETVPGGVIDPLRSVRGLIETAYEFGIRRNRWEGPQRRELKRRLVRAGVDVVLANFGPAGVALLPVCKELKIPLVVHFHGYDAHREETVAVCRDGYAELGAVAKAVIAVSHGMVEALHSYGIPREKIHLVRCGCAPERFLPKSDYAHPPVFLGVGRFVEKKAPYLTIAAFKEVHDSLPDARLVLVGDGPLMEVCRNLVHALNLDAAVEFAGVLSPAEVAERMRLSTAFVQHSLTPEYGPDRGDREGTPVAVLEAMFSGLPVIASRHAGIAEVVDHHEDGILFAERDVRGMAEAMLEVARSSAKARAMGERAAAKARERFTVDQYIGALGAILT